MIAYHVERAKGGNGLNAVEVAAVDKTSVLWILFIAKNKYTNGLKKSNDVVHDVSDKTCIQLWQGGLAVVLD